MVSRSVTPSTATRSATPNSSRIKSVSVTALRAHPRNARTHSKKQIQQIANSMKRFGVINPIVVDDRGQIVAGHARVEATKLLGIKRVPVIRLSHLTEAEVRAYMLADNKLAEKAGWDRGLLAIEFQELGLTLPEIGLELGITGFEPHEMNSVLVDLGTEQKADPTDELPHESGPANAKPGDLFILGHHRLLVGDARDPRAYDRLMGRDVADMIFTDPPYNVPVQGHVGGRGKIKHREFAVASGELTSAQFVHFLRQTLGLCADHLVDGGIAYVCMDWRHLPDVFEAGAAVFSELKNICVWAKTTPGQGSFYRSQHEMVLVYKKGKAPHLNTFELGQHGRTRSNLWTYAGANTFRAGRTDELKMHPTVKPVALIADAMRDCSKRGSIVLDAFAGSASTIAAAELVGRRAYCMEIDPLYADVAIRRWQKQTGRDAVHEDSGRVYSELNTKTATSRQKEKRT